MLLALEVVANNELPLGVGENEIESRALEITGEQQMRVRDDNGVRRRVRGSNGVDAGVPIGMRAETGIRQLRVKYAGVIQSDTVQLKFT